MSRVRFLREITEPATGDHPVLLMASAGEGGVIQRRRDTGSYRVLVKPDGGPAFWCNDHEFEPEENNDGRSD